MASFELAWLRQTDFFPRPPDNWEALSSICIGTKSRALGDALALTTLPQKLKAKYPQLEIYTFPRGFNEIVFRGNPYLSGVQRMPSSVYGDDCNEGSGQLIQRKERYFGVPISEPSRPEIYLGENEKKWATHFSRGSEKPLCVLHPWGATQKKLAPVEFWDKIVKSHASRFRFWQVGLENHSAVQGCEYYHFLSPSRRSSRKLFSVMSLAQAFMGVDSGPMHVASSFGVHSLIFLPPEVRTDDFGQFAPLYPQNSHVSLGDRAHLDKVGGFLETIARKY